MLGSEVGFYVTKDSIGWLLFYLHPIVCGQWTVCGAGAGLTGGSGGGPQGKGTDLKKLLQGVHS